MFATSILDPPVGSLNASSTLLLNGSSEACRPLSLKATLQVLSTSAHICPFHHSGQILKHRATLAVRALSEGILMQRELTYQLPFKRLTRLSRAASRKA